MNFKQFLIDLNKAEIPIVVEGRDDAYRELCIETIAKAVAKIGKILDFIIGDFIDTLEHGYQKQELKKLWDDFVEIYFDPFFPKEQS